MDAAKDAAGAADGDGADGGDRGGSGDSRRDSGSSAHAPPGSVLIRLGPQAPGAGVFLADQLTALLLDRPEAATVVCDVSALDRPTPADLDHLGKLALAAGRSQRGLRLRGTPPRLRLLLTLTGLDGRFQDE